MDSNTIQSIFTNQQAAIGNMQNFAQQMSMPGMPASYATAQPGNPWYISALQTGMMAMQGPQYTPGTIPGSTSAALQTQQYGMRMMGNFISPQTPIVGGVFQQMQMRQAMNQMVQQQSNFARPGGFGFNYPELQRISGFVGQQATQNPMYTTQEMFQMAAGGMQMGMFSGTRDVQGFQNQFRRLLSQVEQVTKVLGGTLQEGLQTVARLRSMGVFGAQAQGQIVQALPALTAGTGIGAQQMMGFGGQVAQGLRPMGVQGPAGAMAGMKMLGTVGTAQAMGAISEQQLWQATGMTGVQGQQALAGMVLQGAARFTQKGGGRIFKAAFYDANTQSFDRDAWEKFQTGQMSFAEVQARAGENVRAMGGALAFRQNEGKIAGEFLQGTGGVGNLVVMREAFKQYASDPTKMQYILMKRAGLSREAAEATVGMLNRLPQIQQEQQYASEVQREQQELSEFWKQRSPEMKARQGMQALKQKFTGVLEKGLTTVLDSYRNSLSQAMGVYDKEFDLQISQGARQSVAKMVSGGAAGRAQMYQQTAQYERMTQWQPGMQAGLVPSTAGVVGGAGGMAFGLLSKVGAAAGTAQGALIGPQTATPLGAPGIGTLAGARQWGLGWGERGRLARGTTFETAAAAQAYAAKKGPGATVIAGPSGFAVKGTMSFKERIQQAQFQSGNITFSEQVWGISQGEANTILGQGTLSEVRSALDKGDWAGAQAIIQEKAKGKNLKPETVNALISSVAQPQTRANMFMKMSRGQLGLASAAGSVEALAGNTGASKEQVGQWLQDPEYQDLFIGAWDDPSKLDEAARKAYASGDKELGDFLGNVRSNWGSTKYQFGQAVGRLGGSKALEYAQTRQDFANRLMKADKTKFTGSLKEALSAAQGSALKQWAKGNISTREAGRSGTVAAGLKAEAGLFGAVESLAYTSSAAEFQAQVGALRGAGLGDLAEAAEAKRGVYKRAMKEKGKIMQTAASELAEVYAGATAKDRKRIMALAKKGKLDVSKFGGAPTALTREEYETGLAEGKTPEELLRAQEKTPEQLQREELLMKAAKGEKEAITQLKEEEELKLQEKKGKIPQVVNFDDKTNKMFEDMKVALQTLVSQKGDDDPTKSKGEQTGQGS